MGDHMQQPITQTTGGGTPKLAAEPLLVDEKEIRDYPELNLDSEKIKQVLTERNKALAGRDTVVLLDYSGSMTTREPSWSNKARSEVQREILTAILNLVLKHDDDGIKVRLIKHKLVFHKDLVKDFLMTEAALKEFIDKFQPGGGTPLVTAVQAELSAYVKKCKEAKDAALPPKKFGMIVITDGEPDDEEATGTTIPRIIQEAACDVRDLGFNPQELFGIQFVLLTENKEHQVYYRRIDNTKTYSRKKTEANPDPETFECDVCDVFFFVEYGLLGGAESPLALAKITAGGVSESFDDLYGTEVPAEIKWVDDFIENNPDEGFVDRPIKERRKAN
ncbi:hypothetical protein BDV96DRAFT_651818 [Lophiotrema nucula]|uniref:VWFA domain-containing protein n=1 Tax=Lophiotrema nucula TaxID=690887 RepID=A0A6A5YTG2_9PLEO|nr:hypothetical protein BDV96DRAFT_651818 [Lophiotrema nucula]